MHPKIIIYTKFHHFCTYFNDNEFKINLEMQAINYHYDENDYRNTKTVDNEEKSK